MRSSELWDGCGHDGIGGKSLSTACQVDEAHPDLTSQAASGHQPRR
jgi:hypothetical protein